MKTCSQCKIEQDLVNFNKDTRRNDDHRSSCRDCDRIKGKLYRSNNVEKLKIDKAEFDVKNRDKLTAYRRKYRAENAEKVKEQDKRYKDTRKEKNMLSEKIVLACQDVTDPKILAWLNSIVNNNVPTPK